MVSFEQNIQKSLFQPQSEKSYIDKLLAKEDINRIKDLIKKPRLGREDLLELLYMLSGAESKLLNYGEWDRYVLLKFFVWIREFIKIAELLYDYQDDLLLKQAFCTRCEGYHNIDESKLPSKTSSSKNICKCNKPEIKFKITYRSKRLLENNERLIEHNAKFLIDLYFNIGRTTLSLGGTGFIELLTNKYEVIYPYGSGETPIEKPQQTGIITTGSRGYKK